MVTELDQTYLSSTVCVSDREGGREGGREEGGRRERGRGGKGGVEGRECEGRK